MTILQTLEGDQGFYSDVHLSAEELTRLRTLVEEQWRCRLLTFYPQLQDRLSGKEMTDYHLIIKEYPEIDHKALWPKRERLLSPKAVSEIRRMPFFLNLESVLGLLGIAAEESIYEQEIYWRLVRPSEPTDVGPMHADSWFWALGHGSMPEGFFRVKLWIGLYCEPGKNGFRFVPGSHKKRWPYKGIERDGLLKPQISLRDDDLDWIPFMGIPGQGILFHDDLLHGGLVGGEFTRVSVECTLLVKRAISTVS